MQKLEAKIPYLGSLPDKDRFYEVASIDYETGWIKVYIDGRRITAASGEFDPSSCEIRIIKDGLFD